MKFTGGGIGAAACAACQGPPTLHEKSHLCPANFPTTKGCNRAYTITFNSTACNAFPAKT
eukprot:2270561-Amphidinium_carterae.1